MEQILKNFINAVRVDLSEKFDQNFRDKAFFTKKWPKTKHANNQGSLMMRSGHLRESLTGKVEGNSIRFQSSMPYAKIHNEGGEITVTAKMKKFFWAMHYKAAGAVSGKGGKRDEALNAEAQKWKFMALMKVGSKITIEQRQFIGYHPQVKKAIENVFKEDFAPQFRDFIMNTIKK